jgi:hypothetical protein
MAGTLPATPAPGPLEWALIVLAVFSFGLVAIAQALFPLWAYHPAAAGLRVHLVQRALRQRRLRQAPARLVDQARILNGKARTMTCPSTSKLSMKTITAASDAADARHPAGLAARLLGRGEPLSRPDGRNAGRDRRAAWPGVAGVPVTMPRAGLPRPHRGRHDHRSGHLDAIAASADAQGPRPRRGQDDGRAGRAHAPSPQPTIADLAAEASGIDWPGHHRRPVRPLGRRLFRPGSGALGRPARRGAYRRVAAIRDP